MVTSPADPPRNGSQHPSRNGTQHPARNDSQHPRRDASHRPLRERPLVIALLTALCGVAILTVYFLVPLASSELGAIERIVGTIAAGVILLLALIYMRRRATNVPLLVVLLVLVAVTFAATFYVIASNRPGEFDGIETRIDALYFTLTTMTTTGYGDIHANGQLSRVLVSVVFVFDIIFLSLVAAEASRIVDARQSRKAEAKS